MNVPVPIAASHLTSVTSSIVKGQRYELQIQFPGGYEQSNKKYPVVYLMDSQWIFPLLTSLSLDLYYDGFIPELIIVGVCWVEPNRESSRLRDFSPTHDERVPHSGGADNFISFMKNELFPFIESNYRGDERNRTLVGNSGSGLLTLYTLFSKPELFRNYIAASPIIGWDNGIIYQYEKKYFEQQHQEAARLYMTIGGVERDVPEFEKLINHLDNRDYRSLKIETKILKNTGHAGSKGEGFSRGLKFAFQRGNVTIEHSLLRLYAGVYQFSDKTYAELKVEGNNLVLYFNRHDKFELVAENNTDFYSNAQFLKLHFIISMNAVSGLQLDKFHISQQATKIR